MKPVFVRVMRMRVISGVCRGRTLAAPAGTATRPTSDRVKEALFSILASRIDFRDICVLDICAGTGGLGIEALSRGAGTCCFIESDRSVKTILDKNLEATGFKDRADVLIMDAVKGLQSVTGRGRMFDLVLFDPPYSSGLYQPVLDALGSSGCLTADSVVVAECSARNPLQESYGRLTRFERRPYGDTVLELYIQEA